MIHSPRRILHPLRRTRPKTASDPGWERISWDEAMSEIADRLGSIAREHGPEAVAFSLSSPSATSLSDSIEWIDRFIRKFGSPNIITGTEVCNWHKDHAHAFTFGVGIPAADYDNADLILLWGHDPATTWLAQATRIGDARARGAQVVAIDPRGTGSVLGSDQWVRLRPGTDGALALGIANLLIRDEAYDADFVRQWTNAPYLVRQDNGDFLRGRDLNGWDDDRFVIWADGEPVLLDPETDIASASSSLLGHCSVRLASGVEVECRTAFQMLADLCAQWPVERVARTTWVEESNIEELAARVGQADRIAYHTWSGVGQHTNATQTERAIAVLYALTGCFDRKGGNVVLETLGTRTVSSPDLLAEAQKQKAIGLAERPLGPGNRSWVRAVDVYEAILEAQPYPVRALFTFGANILLSQPRVERGRKALAALDFAVHCDYFLNPTAEMADIVLPVNTSWEREGLRAGFEITQKAQGHVQLRQRMIPPRGESRSDLEIVFELANRLGFGDEFFDGSIEAAWNHVIEPLGITVEDLRERPKGVTFDLETKYEKYRQRSQDGRIRGFDTPTRRVEIYSEQFQEHGYDPLPQYKEPADTPDNDYPYVLTSGKLSKFRHTQDRGISSLRRKIPEPVVLMHPDAAEASRVRDGDWVVVSTPTAKVRLKAKLDAALHPGVVSSSFGWWQGAADLGLESYDPFADEGSSYNRIIAGEAADPISGSLPLKSSKCAVRPIETPGNLRWEGWKHARVVSVTSEAHGTTSLLLQPVDAQPLPPFIPGQFITVRTDLDGDPEDVVQRSYSLSGPIEGHGNRYRITVKGMGEFSEKLSSAVAVGDTIALKSPEGKFRIPIDADLPVCLVATGSGITPFIGYLETLVRRKSDAEVHLFYASRNSEHHAFKDRLGELESLLPGLTLHTYYSRPGPGDVLGQDYHHLGRVSSEGVPEHLIARNARFYMCGTEQMMSEMRRGLEERGVLPFAIFEERFSSGGGLGALDPSARFKVRFAKSGRQIEWAVTDGTLLDFAETNGVPIRGGCRVGQCESCFVRVLKGSVTHSSPDVEPEDDSGCLTCQAVPAEDLEIDA
ncbi:molybdopterin-dependent oxidoreductase [Leucobacter sp. GX24907]